LYQPRVERLALRLLGWRRADVEDVVQDVFLAAFTKAGRVRGDGGAAVWAWLATITVNACRTRHRRNGVFDKLLARLSMSASEHAALGPAKAETDDTLARVRDAIERLGGSEREVVVLHCLEGMRLGDVAEVLGISGNAVQIRLHRARQRLKRELDGET
jgi:RNA polymerase sigma-70 factor (ECF subfamily)